MGTFRLKAGTIQSQNGITNWLYNLDMDFNPRVPSNAQLLLIINEYPPTVIDFIAPDYAYLTDDVVSASGGSIVALPNSNGWYLDGSALPTTIANLPSGFTIVDARVEAYIKTDVSNDNIWNLKAGAYSGGNHVNPFTIQNVPPLTPNSLVTVIFGIAWNSNINDFIASSLQIFGTYSIVTWTFTVGISGNNIVITGFTGDPNLTTVSAITLNYMTGSITKKLTVLPAKFTTQTPTSLICPIPGTCDVPGTTTVSLVIGGVETAIGTIAIT